MTVKEKQGFGLYFLLAFGLAWLLQVYASLLLLRDGNAAAYQLLLAVSMFCPLVSVLLVQKFWLHQPTGISWRPRLKGNGRYLLAANQDTDNICVFAIDEHTGGLKEVWNQENVYCVTCISF